MKNSNKNNKLRNNIKKRKKQNFNQNPKTLTENIAKQNSLHSHLAE